MNVTLRLFLFLLFYLFSLFSESAKPLSLGNRHRIEWVNCIIVTTKGDTIYSQVKNKKDYSAEGSLTPNYDILIRMTNDGIKKVSIGTIRELYITDSVANNKYLSLHDYSGSYRLYRVITDGPCKLLSTEIPGNVGKMVATTSGGGQNYGTQARTVAVTYNIYYQGKITPVVVDEGLNLSPVSRRECTEIFQECPDLAEQLNRPKPKLTNLSEMVKIFNACSVK
jgi:hypothetical protein